MSVRSKGGALALPTVSVTGNLPTAPADADPPADPPRLNPLQKQHVAQGNPTSKQPPTPKPYNRSF